jgi:hypothetical protein
LICLVAILVAAGTARFSARLAAVEFGRRVTQAVSVVSNEGFADTAAFREWFNDPDVAKYVNRARMVSFLGSGYVRRMNDLQTGMLYCSEQASLPPERRFVAPPPLKYLKIETGDHSDEGVTKAVESLIVTYHSRL